MLHKIDSLGWNRKTAYCVPTAISFLTGIPLIHSHSRAAFLQGICLDEVEEVNGVGAVLLLREQGYSAIPIKLKYSTAPSLITFMNDRTAYEKCIPMMVQVENNPDFCHMISCHFGYAADNWTMKPVKLEDFPHLGCYVTKAWSISKSISS